MLLFYILIRMKTIVFQVITLSFGKTFLGFQIIRHKIFSQFLFCFSATQLSDDTAV